MKKQIEKIRTAKNWRERVAIARDEKPGTVFDGMVEESALAIWFERDGHIGNARASYESLGRWLAANIEARQIQLFHDLAKALEKWKRHKPKRNFEAEVFFSMTGMFPPGWTKKWVCRDEKGNLIRDSKTGKLKLGVKPGTRDKIAMRDLKRNLARIKPNFSEENWESSRKKFQRYAKEFNYQLDDTPGCPPKTLRHNPAKKR